MAADAPSTASSKNRLGEPIHQASPLAAPMWHLLKREWLRFIRQPTRIVAAIGTPALLWLVFGSGFAGTFGGERAAMVGMGADNYAAYLLPGMATMIVLFSSIFASMSLIEDRQAGFLQSILVSPAPRFVLIGSKVGAGAILGAAQGAIILAAAPLLGLSPGPLGFFSALAALVLISIGLTGLGLAAAWKVNSSQGFHGVMNLVLMPMWLLSGAVFPLEGAAGWMAWLMRLNPLTWGTEALRSSLAGAGGVATAVDGGSWGAWWWWLGAVAFVVAGVALAAAMIDRRKRSARRSLDAARG